MCVCVQPEIMAVERFLFFLPVLTRFPNASPESQQMRETKEDSYI
jgi:hypothetical protein